MHHHFLEVSFLTSIARCCVRANCHPPSQGRMCFYVRGIVLAVSSILPTSRSTEDTICIGYWMVNEGTAGKLCQRPRGWRALIGHKDQLVSLISVGKSSLPSYHDNVMSWEVVWKLHHIAPVCRLLAGNDYIRGPYFHGLHVSGQFRGSDVRLQQLYPLQPLVDGRDVDCLERRDRFLKDPIDKVHSAILEMRNKGQQGASCPFMPPIRELHGKCY